MAASELAAHTPGNCAPHTETKEFFQEMGKNSGWHNTPDATFPAEDPKHGGSLSRGYIKIHLENEFPEQEKTADIQKTVPVLRKFGLPAFAFRTLARFYANHTKNMLRNVPKGRMFVAEVEDLSDERVLGDILGFLTDGKRATISDGEKTLNKCSKAQTWQLQVPQGGIMIFYNV